MDKFTGEEVSIDKQVACEECPRWLKMTEVACEKTEVAVCLFHEVYILDTLNIMFGIFFHVGAKYV